MSEMMTKIFVYGTLKKGQWNNSVLGASKLLGDGEVSGKWRMICAGFPVVLPSQDQAAVTGEIYEVDSETLDRLDALEGEGRMYFRIRVRARLNGRFVSAQMYVGSPKMWNRRHLEAVKTVDGRLTWRESQL